MERSRLVTVIAFIATISVLVNLSNAKIVSSQEVKYYFNKVVPDFQQGLEKDNKNSYYYYSTDGKQNNFNNIFKISTINHDKNAKKSPLPSNHVNPVEPAKKTFSSGNSLGSGKSTLSKKTNYCKLSPQHTMCIYPVSIVMHKPL